MLDRRTCFPWRHFCLRLVSRPPCYLTCDAPVAAGQAFQVRWLEKQGPSGWRKANHRLRPSHGAHREDFVREFGDSRQGLGEHTRSELSHFEYLAFPLARD